MALRGFILTSSVSPDHQTGGFQCYPKWVENPGTSCALLAAFYPTAPRSQHSLGAHHSPCTQNFSSLASVTTVPGSLSGAFLLSRLYPRCFLVSPHRLEPPYMLGMLRTAMPSRDVLLRSSRVPSHCQGQGWSQGGWGSCAHHVEPPPLSATEAVVPEHRVTLEGLWGTWAAPEWLEKQIPSHFAFLELMSTPRRSLCCSPLYFHKSFTTGPKWQFPKKQIPRGPHKTLARLSAVTQNGRQHHLDPKATSTQGAPAPASPLSLSKLTPKDWKVWLPKK